MKRYITILILTAIILSVFSACGKEQPVIDVEPEITQIRSICELATLECYYHNVAKGTKEAGKGLEHWGEIDRTFWIEFTGTVKIGIDLKKVEMDISDSKVTITIPQAKMLESSIEMPEEDSVIASADSLNSNKITMDDLTNAVKEARVTMEANASKDQELLSKAQDRAKKLIANYIQQISAVSGKTYEIEWIYK